MGHPIPPPLVSHQAWAGAGETARKRAVEATIAALGEGWRSMGTTRSGNGARAAKTAPPHAVLAHATIPSSYILVPGGAIATGASAEEIDALRTALATAGPEAVEALAAIPRRSEAARVELAPFLIGRFPWSPEAVKHVVPDLVARDQPALVSIADAERVARAAGLSLPTEAEWEFACRAGSTTPFYWGSDAPTARRWAFAPDAISVTNTNAFGVVAMGAFPEACAPPPGQERHPVRGGAAMLHPWQGVGEWILMASAYTERPSRPPSVALRFVLRPFSSDAGVVVPPPKATPRPAPEVGAGPVVHDGIKEALADRDNARALSLRNRRLKKVPASLGKLQALERLDLSVNWLTEIPEAVFGLPRLKALAIGGNQFSTCPTSLGRLVGLEELSVGHANWKTVCAELFTLVGLKRLELSWLPRVEAIPDAIGDLTALEHLDLTQCAGLTTFPAGVLALAKLETLIFSECRFEQVPAGIGALTRLRTLRLAATPVKALPEEIGNLGSLEELSLLDSKCLRTLPACIGKLRRLRALNFSPSYELKEQVSLPPSFAELTNLEALSLGYGQLTTIPEPIFALPALRTLSLHSNRLVYDAAMFERLARMPKLATLGLHHNEGLVPHADAIRAALPHVTVELPAWRATSSLGAAVEEPCR